MQGVTVLVLLVVWCTHAQGQLPSAPTITMAVSQSPTSIALTWTQPVGEVVESYEVSFSYQGPCSGFSHTNTTTVADTTRQFTLTGLQEFSNYTVIVVAVNGAGRSGGSSVNVVTLPDAPSDSPTEVAAVATNPVTILIQWGRVPCINRNSNITGYTVRYSRGGGSTESVSVSGTDQSERTYTATLLVRSTSYSIQVAAVTSTGVTGPFSTTVTGTTSPPRSVLVLNGAIIPNHGFVLLNNIGESRESLLCLTDSPACCQSAYTGGRGPLGHWFFPNGTRVPNAVVGMAGGDYGGKLIIWDFYRNRGPSVVLLHRRRGGVTGIYRCVIPDATGVDQTMYIGLYTASSGNLEINSMTLTSELDSTLTLVLTLTCTSTGGPATTVSWTVNNHTVTEDRNHHITSQILTDPVTATYNHMLTVTGRLMGEYKCNVSNNKPSTASRSLRVRGTNSPTSLAPQRVNSTSIRVTWTPPSSGPTVTGYRVYYQTEENQESVEVGASVTEYTITGSANTSRYIIALVAVSNYLPSARLHLDFANSVLVSITIGGNPTLGEPYTLTCGVSVDSGITGTPTVQWMGPHSSAPITTGRDYTVSSTPPYTLTINPLRQSHAGQYTCQTWVENDTGTASVTVDIIELTITVDASITSPTGPFTAGQSYTLTCTATVTGGETLSTTTTITWIHPSGNVTLGTGSSLNLSFNPLRVSDAGQYTCKISVFSPFFNRAQNSTDTYTVNVQVPPPDVNFDLTSPETITYTGNSITLSCRITLLGGVTDSDVVVNSTWTKDGALFSGVSGRVTLPPKIRVNTRVFIAQLVFSPPSSSVDNGTYTCVVIVTPSQTEFVTGAMGSGSLAFAVRAPTGPPQSFTLTPGARNMTFSWSPPAPTLHNGVIAGYFLSCVPEAGGRNSISMQNTAAGTFTLRGFTPATSYNCSISASNSWGNGPVAYRIVSTLDDSMLFQLQLNELPSTCRMWMGIDTSAKLRDVIAAVVQNTERVCQCGFNAEYITEYAFQCFPNSDQQVTFRARLHGTAHATSVQLIEDIQQWVNRVIPVAVQGIRVNIDTCPVAITSFGDAQCPETTQPTSVTTQTFQSHPSTTSQITSETPSTSIETTSNSNTTETALLYTTVAIVGGVVAVMIALILAVTVIVIAVLVTKNKYSTDQDVGKQQAKWSEVAGASTGPITTTRCEAYALTELGHEYAMDPEPEYDLVTAFEGGQQIQGRHEYGNITARPPVPTLLETSGRMENQ